MSAPLTSRTTALATLIGAETACELAQPASVAARLMVPVIAPIAPGRQRLPGIALMPRIRPRAASAARSWAGISHLPRGGPSALRIAPEPESLPSLAGQAGSSSAWGESGGEG